MYRHFKTDAGSRYRSIAPDCRLNRAAIPVLAEVFKFGESNAMVIVDWLTDPPPAPVFPRALAPRRYRRAL
ncbi:hypothetical protein KCP69_03215 [Salmonella enterica subsp. enterica]|nr:hypothetical protein KCP69_03215 [Salmonella enterica subsp. enterica]